MKYKLKNFDTVDNNKIVGLWVENDAGSVYLIDKTIPIVEGQSIEAYVQQAIELSQEEIKSWNDTTSLIGKEFNIQDNKFE
jgi:hypothetical protein